MIARAALPLLPGTARHEVWFSRCPVPTPFSLALRLGWFEREFAQDPNVLWRSLGESSEEVVRNAHFTHAQADVFRHGGNVPAIWARAQGADTRLIAISWVTMRQQVQVLPESGIRSAADLAGKRLLLQRHVDASIDYWRASTLRTYEAALASAGLGFDDVSFVEQPSIVGARTGRAVNPSADGAIWDAERSEARRRELLLPLLRGEVDAIATQAHYGVELEGLIGARTIFDRSLSAEARDRINNDTPDVLTVSASLIARRPEIVTRVLLQLLRARDWAAARRDAVVQAMASEFKTSETLVERAWGDDLLDGLDIALEPHKVDAIREQQRFLLAHGFIEQAFDVEQWIDRRPLEIATRLHERERRYGAISFSG